MRTAKVIDRLKAEQAKNPDVPHYDRMGMPWPQPPSDVKTAGYWKLEGRRPARGEQPCAFVVSGHGSRYNPTGWVAAYHLSQTVEIRRRQAWPEAQAVHGIRPEDVATAPELATVAARLAEVIEAADALVIYNAPFDLGFLPARVRKLAAQKAVCAMEAYALWVGDWNDYHGNYRWFRLTAAAMAAGHTWSGQAHRALADTLAARSVWRWLHAQTLPKQRDV